MKLSPEVTINITPDTFQFICEGNQISLDTYVCLTYDENGKYDFASIGEEASSPDSVFVRLFENLPLDPSIDRFELLTGFMQYGMGKVLEDVWYPVLRPLIILKGADSFRTYFSGYHKFFLEAMALAGGAKEVRFE